MRRVIRIIKIVFVVIGLLLLVAIPVSGVISAAVHWQGSCLGPSGDILDCSWWQYAGREMFWGVFIFIPYLFAVTLVFLVIALIQFIAALLEKKRRKTRRS